MKKITEMLFILGYMAIAVFIVGMSVLFFSFGR